MGGEQPGRAPDVCAGDPSPRQRLTCGSHHPTRCLLASPTLACGKPLEVITAPQERGRRSSLRGAAREADGFGSEPRAGAALDDGYGVLQCPDFREPPTARDEL